MIGYAKITLIIEIYNIKNNLVPFLTHLIYPIYPILLDIFIPMHNIDFSKNFFR